MGDYDFILSFLQFRKDIENVYKGGWRDEEEMYYLSCLAVKDFMESKAYPELPKDYYI